MWEQLCCVGNNDPTSEGDARGVVTALSLGGGQGKPRRTGREQLVSSSFVSMKGNLSFKPLWMFDHLYSVA